MSLRQSSSLDWYFFPGGMIAGTMPVAESQMTFFGAASAPGLSTVVACHCSALKRETLPRAMAATFARASPVFALRRYRLTP